MATATNRNNSRRRTASKEVRRQQLIKATIKSIAKRGLNETTMADVAHEAGLSQGIINLHFQSKGKLLLETLRFIADDYRSAWGNALAAAGSNPADKIIALVELDFSTRICDKKKLSVWFAFWGEAKSRPTYLKVCAERDKHYDEAMTDICRDIIAEGGYTGAGPKSIALGLSAMVEGLWLDLLVGSEGLDRVRAKNICLGYLAGVFPEHFVQPERN